MHLVTGGAGFFGEKLVKKLLNDGEEVLVFDINKPNFNHPKMSVIRGDVRNQDDVELVFRGVKKVFHCVAQVPVAKDKKLFWEVNYQGMGNILRSARNNSVEHVVYISSSAVFGVPHNNPVTQDTIPIPMESYGKAKLAAEELCKQYVNNGLNCSIIRPRTIMGIGRLGIFQILFEWVFTGQNIPVLGTGDNIYQFLHADDLVAACVAAATSGKSGTYNVGAEKFGSMREVLEDLTQYAGTGSKVKSVPAWLAETGMNITSSLGLSPLGPYHSLMYGKSMYFDLNSSKKELGYNPVYSNNQMFRETYDWYCENRNDILSGDLDGSQHQSAIKHKILRFLPYFL